MGRKQGTIRESVSKSRVEVPLDEQRDIDDWHIPDPKLTSSELNSHVGGCEQSGSM